MSQLTVEASSAVQDGLGPDVLLHSLSRWYPRPTRFTPAWRTRNRHFHSELVANADGVLECIFPFRGHVHQALINNLWCLQGRIEVLEPRNPRPMHPLEVEFDAFFRDVPIHPVPPDARLRCSWWIFEPFRECVLGSLGHANSNEEDRCQCRNREASPHLFHNWQISNEGG